MQLLLAIPCLLAPFACQTAAVQDAADYAVVSAGGSQSSHLVLNDDEHGLILVLSGEDGKVVALLDGEVLPDDRVVRDGDRLSVLDADGGALFEVRLLEGGGMAYPYDAAVGSRGAGLAWAHAGGQRKLIGVTTASIESTLAAQLGISTDSGFVITEVTEGMPARRAGVQPHDIVLRIEDEGPASVEHLREALAVRQPGESIRLSLLRAGQPLELAVEVEQPRSGVGVWTTELAEGAGGRLGFITSRSAPGSSFAYALDMEADERLAFERAEVERAREQLALASGELDRRRAELETAGDALARASRQRDVASAVERVEQARARLTNVEALIAAQRASQDNVLQIMQLARGDDDRRSVLLSSPSPLRSTGPGEGALEQSLQQRFGQLEERLMRLEELLARLVETREAEGSADDGH